MFLKIIFFQTVSVGEYGAVPLGLRRERGVELSRVCEDHQDLFRERSDY